MLSSERCRRLIVPMLAFAPALLVGVACKESIHVSRTAYIIGPGNDIIAGDAPVRKRMPSGVAEAAVLLATKQQSRKVKFCSGTLIAGEPGEPYRVVTNHHCFAVPGEDGKATPTLMIEACTNTTAYFGFTPDREGEPIGIGCKAGTLRTNFDGDVAVFTLSRNPPHPHNPLPISEAEDVDAGTEAVIVHYPDIKERSAIPPEQAVNLPTMSVTVTDCKVVGNFKVSEWHLDRTLPYSLRHSCDLIHGSSGSALVSRTSGEVIGVNWGGIKISYDEGIRTDNVATKASFVRAFLDNRLDEVIARTRGRGETQDAIAGVPSAETAEAQQESPKKKNRLCGTIGSLNVDSTGLWSLLAYVLVPTAVLFARRRKEA